ncbi:MAG: DUF1552 domain-containing protein [Akkermansiaceae bacterium]|nr:DUF1552 domain-containing protein [Akkermansiaceae bacterium]
MRQNNYLIDRRTLLKGAGACLALPALDIMNPALGAPQQNKMPMRLGVFYKGNGVHPLSWDVSGSQNKFTMSPILQPLAPHQKDILALTNVGNFGNGFHEHAPQYFMSGEFDRTNPKYSFDQLVADSIGNDTLLKSFQLSADPVETSTPHYNSLSYDKSGKSLFTERDMHFAFDTLFKGHDKKRMDHTLSVLDVVSDQTKSLIRKSSRRDKETISRYLDAVRELEMSIGRQKEDKSERLHLDKVKQPTFIDKFDKRMKSIMDMTAMAFWTDTTRVMSCIMAVELSRRLHEFLDVKNEFHRSSHFVRNMAALPDYNKINSWYVSQFAYLISQLKSLKEPDGTSVFDNSVLMFGSGMKHGDYHTVTDLPLVISGGGGGQLKTGRWLKYPNKVPMSDFLLSMIKLFDPEIKEYGGSTTPLEGLTSVVHFQEVEDDGQWKELSVGKNKIKVRGQLVLNADDAGRSYLLKQSDGKPIVIKAAFMNLHNHRVDDHIGRVLTVEGEFKTEGDRKVIHDVKSVTPEK